MKPSLGAVRVAAPRDLRSALARRVRAVKLYHYTIGFHLPTIVEEGLLRANARHRGSAISVLWLSTNAVWEPSAVKSVVDADGSKRIIGLDELVTRGRGVFRIEVEPHQRLYSWEEYVPMSGIDPDFARHLDESGREGGADPAQWKVCLEDLPRAQWRAIELYDPATRHWTELT